MSSPRKLPLARRRSSRIGAATAGLALLSVAVGWFVFCWTAKPGRGAADDAELILRAMSLISFPSVWIAVRLGMDAMAIDRLLVEDDVLTIESSRLLYGPLTLSRTDVAGVVIDPDGTTSGHERLRFPLDREHEYIYSSIRGSVLPVLSREPVVPTVAIVFKVPRELRQPRRRRVADAFAPLHPLKPGDTVRGILLATSGGTETRDLLAGWENTAAAQAALVGWNRSVTERTDRPAGVGSLGSPATWKPMTANRPGTWWVRWLFLPLAFLALVSFPAVELHRAGYGIGAEIALATALLCMLGGVILDQLRRQEERTGGDRILGVVLFGVGLATAFAVFAAESSYGIPH